MKFLITFLILFGVSAFANETNEIQLITIVTTNVETGDIVAVVTNEVFMRNGETNLIRRTRVSGISHSVIQKFYHNDLWLGYYVQRILVVNKSALKTGSIDFKPSLPYELDFGLGASNEMKMAYISDTNGVLVDAFTCTNGIFVPANSSFIRELNKEIGNTTNSK